MRVTIKTANTNLPNAIAVVYLNLKANVICANCGREDFNNSKAINVPCVPCLDEIGIIEQNGHVIIHPVLC